MPPEPAADAALTAIRVWDLPTRLFHWTLAAALVALVVTAHVGGAAMPWHFRLGYVVFGLLLFRLLWGFVGGHWSRFSRFVYGSSTVFRYLRGQGRADEHLDVGHNPLGALSVFALLGLLCVQVATGLVADDEIASTGPLNRFVSSRVAGKASYWHADVGQWIIIGLVILHIGAVTFHLLRHRNNLIRPMIVGDKALPAATPATRDSAATRWLALLLAGLCAGLVSWIVSLGN
jgi:cytochrome b